MAAPVTSLLQLMPAQQSDEVEHCWPWLEQHCPLTQLCPFAQQSSPHCVHGWQVPEKQTLPWQHSPFEVQAWYCRVQQALFSHCWSLEQHWLPQALQGWQIEWRTPASGATGQNELLQQSVAELQAAPSARQSDAM